MPMPWKFGKAITKRNPHIREHSNTAPSINSTFLKVVMHQATGTNDKILKLKIK